MVVDRTVNHQLIARAIRAAQRVLNGRIKGQVDEHRAVTARNCAPGEEFLSGRIVFVVGVAIDRNAFALAESGVEIFFHLVDKRQIDGHQAVATVLAGADQ